MKQKDCLLENCVCPIDVSWICASRPSLKGGDVNGGSHAPNELEYGLCHSPTAFRWSLPFLCLIHMCLDLLTWRGRGCMWTLCLQHTLTLQTTPLWTFSARVTEISFKSKLRQKNNPQTKLQNASRGYFQPWSAMLKWAALTAEV